MRTLKPPYLFATDGDYAGGALDWSGQPRVVIPSVGTLSAGFTPDQPVPAETMNYLQQLTADALAVQARGALKNWTSVSIPSVGTDQYRAVVGMRIARGYGAPSEAQREVIAVGADLAASNKVRLAHTADGSGIELSPLRLDSIGAFQLPLWAVPGNFGELILLNDSILFAYTSDSGNTWTLNPGYSGPPAVYAAHYVSTGSALGYYAITSQTSNQVVKGSSLANLAAGAGGFTTIATPATSAFAAGKVEFADNSGGVLLVAGVTVAGAAQIYASTNAGATWATVLSFSGGCTNCNVVYSTYWGLFVAWGDDGQLFTSADGISWQFIRTGLDASNGFLASRGSLACVGPAVVKTVVYASAYGVMSGIAFSFDVGATWSYHYMVPGNFIISAIRAINGRLYLTALGKLWRSDLLEVTETEL